ncbi:8489_t:CDS:2, partial [Gigaspora margarita]
MSSKKQVKKTTLSNEQRKKIIKYKKKNPSISHVDFAAWVKEQFNLEVHSTTIERLVKNKNNIGDNPSKKRQTTVQYPDLENTLLEHNLEQIKKHKEDAFIDDNVVAVAIPQLREVLKEY